MKPLSDFLLPLVGSLALVSDLCTAPVPMDDPRIQLWASAWIDPVSWGESVGPDWQDPHNALGPAQGDLFSIVSLGRGGSLTLTFDEPVFDGPGPDFAIFENAFSPFFLELAYVEVSSNGDDFIRFPNRSSTPNPIGAFGRVDPNDVAGLAGKYPAGEGTPFDLASLRSLQSSEILNFHAIHYIRIIDVPGDGSAFDSHGDPIYDPYPTQDSAGFDLDAVAVLNTPPAPPPEILHWAPLPAEGAHLIDWHGSPRRAYQLAYSANLDSWNAVPLPKDPHPVLSRDHSHPDKSAYRTEILLPTAQATFFRILETGREALPQNE